MGARKRHEGGGSVLESTPRTHRRPIDKGARDHGTLRTEQGNAEVELIVKLVRELQVSINDLSQRVNELSCQIGRGDSASLPTVAERGHLLTGEYLAIPATAMKWADFYSEMEEKGVWFCFHDTGALIVRIEDADSAFQCGGLGITQSYAKSLSFSQRAVQEMKSGTIYIEEANVELLLTGNSGRARQILQDHDIRYAPGVPNDRVIGVAAQDAVLAIQLIDAVPLDRLCLESCYFDSGDVIAK